MFEEKTPGSKGGYTDSEEVDHAIKAKEVCNSSNEEDDGDRAKVVEHQLEGKDTAFDPLRRHLLHSSLGRNVDKVERYSGDEHEQCDGEQKQGAGIPSMWL